jgi:3-deoxy-D-manno-octulosonic-acid transferase
LDLFYALYQIAGSPLSIPPILLSAFQGRFGGRWEERLGFPVSGLKKPLWLHAASAGESGSALSLIRELKKRRGSLNFVLSVSTPLGLAYAEADLKNSPIEDLRLLAPPLDFFWSPGRYLRRIDPQALIVLETELWPGLVLKARKLGLPFMIAAGRVSKKSARRYRLIAPVVKRMLAGARLVAAAGEGDKERFLELGARPERLFYLGNPKFDRLIAEAQRIDPAPSSLTPPFVVTAGSTHPGEEEIILGALLKARIARALGDLGPPPEIKLILAPRHVNRARELKELAEKNGFQAAIVEDPAVHPSALPEVSVVNVMGRLPEFYARSDLALVGGSFVRRRGHNPLEPAAQGRAAVFGPDMSSFNEEAGYLMKRKAAKMVLPVNLPALFSHFLETPATAMKAGINALEAVRGMTPAAPRTAEAILNALDEEKARS